MNKKYLFIILAVVAAIGTIFLFFSGSPPLEAQKLVQADNATRVEAASFIQSSLDILNNDGRKRFRKLWRKVDDMQYSANMRSLDGAELSSPRILSVVKPKVSNKKVYVYTRFPEMDYDIQFVLEEQGRGVFKIAGVYETREFR
jgi:hypothetical protein